MGDLPRRFSLILSEQLRGQILINLPVALLPVVADGDGQFFCGYRQPDRHERNILIHGGEFGFEFAVDGAVVVAPNGGFLPHFQFVLFQILLDLVLDGIADPVLEIGQGVPPFRRDLQMGAVGQRFGVDQPRLRQFVDRLLHGEKTGIFLFEKEIADLSPGERESDLIEHIEDDQFIKSQRFLMVHNNFLV